MNKGAWDEARERVREVADIVQIVGEHVRLKKAGAAFTGLCPFHGEKTPSFSVNPQRQFFHCFGCHESGDVFAFMMKYHHMTFPDALKELAQRYQIDLPERTLSDAEQVRLRQREQLYRVHQEAAGIFHKTLVDSAQAKAARLYLHERGVPHEAIEKYQLGYVPAPEHGGWQYLISRLRKKNFSVEVIEQAGLAVRKAQGRYYDRFRDRVLFPIYDMSGREVAFGGRILGQGKPKYMNSPESMIFTKSKLLFGLYQHRQAIRSARCAIVVEGNFDLLLLAIHGIENVVAPLGTALTREHVKALRRYCDEVVLLFDGDSAGLRAARRSIPFFLSEQLEVRVALLPTGHDPDTLVREKGATAVKALIEAADPLAEFVFSALKEEHGLTLSGKNRIIAELTELVNQAAHADQQELMAAHFAGQLGVSPERFIVEKKGTGQVEQAPVPLWPPECPSEGGGDEWGPPPGFPSDGGEEWEEHSFLVPEDELSGSLYGISKTQQQLLDLLLLYPEFLPRLLAGGLKEALGASPVIELVDAMEQLTADGVFTAEQLLAVVPSGDHRQYIAEVLTRESGSPFCGFSAEVGEDEEQGICTELLVWLQEMQRQRKVDEVQKQISVAEHKGDFERVSELQRQYLRCKAKKSRNEN
ncbi:MAG: DNA primase [Candidatus Electrothrix sp. MAN1_4]|nr:DNA primase [Candidatus Electrothrix sp. MAN1_4]